MYESYWQLQARPCENCCDPRFYFPCESHQAALLKLRYTVENRRGGAVQVYKTAYVSTPVGSWQRRQAQEKLTQTLTRLGHPDLADEQLLRLYQHPT